MSEPNARMRYLLITNRDHDEFNRQVNEALARGYQLHGSTMFAADPTGVVAGQALILPPRAFTDAFPPEMRRMMGMPE
jgi:hypothetical protein